MISDFNNPFKMPVLKNKKIHWLDRIMTFTCRLILIPIMSGLLVPLGTCGHANAQESLSDFIRTVQENSQRSYDFIQTVAFKGYSKTFVYFGYSPLEVDLVPMYDEYYFDGFWMKPDSLRMVVKALRVYDSDADTAREEILKDIPLPNPFHFIYDPSSLNIRSERDVKIWPLYPFALGADSVYRYHREGEIGFGDNRILLVHVVPINPDTPGVVGTFMIDAHRCEVVGSDIRFNEAISLFRQAVKNQGRVSRLLLTGTDNHRIKTEKELLYASYWLPTTMEEEFVLRFWGMDIMFHRFIEFDSYVINPETPDSSLLSDEKIVYDRDPEFEKEVFKDLPYSHRLSKEEERQIAGHLRDRLLSSDLLKELLDSEDMAREAASMAMNQRFGRHLRFARTLGEYVLFNRVESLRFHHRFGVSNWPLNNLTFSVGGGYGIGDRRWKGEASALYFLNKRKTLFLEGALYHTTGYEESRRLISTGNNTFTALLYKGDYRDYYYKSGGSFGLGIRMTDQLALKLAFVSQKEKDAAVKTRFSIFHHSRAFRPNPEIVQGWFRGLRASLLYRSHDFDADLMAEATHPDLLGSDFSYRCIKAGFWRRWHITNHSNLHLDVSGGYAWGSLPPQRWFDFGGRTFLNYHGCLRGVQYKAFTGDRMAQATLEYGINGSTFYDLGIKQGWIRAIKWTFWSGVGWSDLSARSRQLAQGLNVPSETADGPYYEFGLGIGDVLNIFRVDFVRTRSGGDEILVRWNMLQ